MMKPTARFMGRKVLVGNETEVPCHLKLHVCYVLLLLYSLLSTSTLLLRVEQCSATSCYAATSCYCLGVQIQIASRPSSTLPSHTILTTSRLTKETDPSHHGQLLRGFLA